MWQVLFYVAPLTVGLVLVALSTGAFYLARSELCSATGLPRGLLAACTLLFLLVIASPLGEWDRVGTHTRDLDWDPVGDISEAFADTGPHGYFSTDPTDGRLAQHTSEKPPADERVAFHGIHGTAFFLHGDTGNIEIVDPERNEASRHILTLLLFVPVGILAFYSFTQCWARLSFGPVLSVSVESVQWAMAAGNNADTADVMLNTAGSLVGTVIALVCLRTARWVHTGPRTVRRPRCTRPWSGPGSPPRARALRRWDHNGNDESGQSSGRVPGLRAARAPRRGLARYRGR